MSLPELELGEDPRGERFVDVYLRAGTTVVQHRKSLSAKGEIPLRVATDRRGRPLCARGLGTSRVRDRVPFWSNICLREQQENSRHQNSDYARSPALLPTLVFLAALISESYAQSHAYSTSGFQNSRAKMGWSKPCFRIHGGPQFLRFSIRPLA